jgi:hypothetical protein
MFFVQFTSHNFVPSFVLLYENYIAFQTVNDVTIAAIEAEVAALDNRCPIEFDAVREVIAMFHKSSGFVKADPDVLSTGTPHDTEFGCGTAIEPVNSFPGP